MMNLDNGLPNAVNQMIAQRYGGKEVVCLDFPVWSTIRFQAAIAAGPPVLATIDTTPRTAFSYGLNQDMAAAGRAGVVATPADTNLQQGGQTRDQADVFVYGLSAFVEPNSDAGFLPDLFRETDVTISTNGDTTLPLGKLADFPSAGGLFGAGKTSLLLPDLATSGGVDGGPGVLLPFVNNGNPTSKSRFELTSPVFWSGVGGGADSSLSITCTPRRTITKTSAVARATAAGVAVFTPITATQALVDIRMRLFAVSVRLRSANT